MKNNVTKIMNFVLLIVLMGVTFYVIFSKNDIGQIIDLIVNRKGSVKQLVLGVLMGLGSIACEALIIYIMFRVLEERTRYYICLKYSFIGFYYCAITPSATGGQPVQVYYMTKDGHKISTASLVILIIIITYKVALLALIGAVAIFDWDKMVAALTSQRYVLPCFIFGLLVNAVCVALYIMVLISSDLLKRVVIAVLKFFARIKLIRKVDKKIDKAVGLIDDYNEGVKFIKSNFRVLCPIMLITLVQRVMLFSIPYVVFLFLGADNSIGYIDILTLQIVINTAADSLPVPGGIGINEGLSSTIYGLIYSNALVVPAMVMTRGVNFYAMLIVSAIISLIVYIRTSCRIKRHA